MPDHALSEELLTSLIPIDRVRCVVLLPIQPFALVFEVLSLMPNILVL